ncbi:MAG: hypothetical protein ACKOQ3_03595 [Novosphingobium sp.]
MIDHFASRFSGSRHEAIPHNVKSAWAQLREVFAALHNEFYSAPWDQPQPCNRQG